MSLNCPHEHGIPWVSHGYPMSVMVPGENQQKLQEFIDLIDPESLGAQGAHVADVLEMSSGDGICWFLSLVGDVGCLCRVQYVGPLAKKRGMEELLAV